MNDLFERIRADEPEHMQMIVEDHRGTESYFDKFAVESRWQSSASVNVFEVNGSIHFDYIGNSWLWLLENGKRMSVNLKLCAENPEYYFQQNKKTPEMYFTSCGRSLFVTGDGNHRTCIAKALYFYSGRTDIHGVVQKTIIHDDALLNAYEVLTAEPQYLVKSRLWVDVSGEITGRRDASGWKTDIFKPVIVLRNRRGDTLRLNSKEAHELNHELRSGGFFRRFRTNRYAKFINN